VTGRRFECSAGGKGRWFGKTEGRQASRGDGETGRLLSKAVCTPPQGLLG